MTVTKKQHEEFGELVKPLMEWLNNHFHPHITIIITQTNAEVLEGLCSVHATPDYPEFPDSSECEHYWSEEFQHPVSGFHIRKCIKCGKGNY